VAIETEERSDMGVLAFSGIAMHCVLFSGAYTKIADTIHVGIGRSPTRVNIRTKCERIDSKALARLVQRAAAIDEAKLANRNAGSWELIGGEAPEGSPALETLGA